LTIARPVQHQQIFPFWTGLHANILDSCPRHMLDTCVPVIDSQMKCLLFMQPRQNVWTYQKTLSGNNPHRRLVNNFLIITTYQINNAICIWISYFEIWWIPHLYCFAACIRYSGLRDIFFDSEVYFCFTGDSMLSEK